MSKKVLVPIADGSEEIEAVCVIDCLRRAGAEVTVASVGGIRVTMSRCTVIVADCLLSDCAGTVFDLIALPGGMPGAEHLRDCGLLIDMLKAQKQAGKFFAGICATPPVVFEPNGLLEGLRASCYPPMLDRLSNPADIGQTVVVDNNCITAQGPATAIEFSLKLIELLLDKPKAESIAEALLADYTH